MRTVGWMLVAFGTLCVSSTAQSADILPDGTVMERAMKLAAPHVNPQLQVVLTATLPPGVSKNAEAWTTFREDGSGDGVFVYTGSAVFRCARERNPNQDRCLLKLASIVVHEAWHLQHGRDEEGAYRAQLVFLQSKEAASFLQVNESAAADIAAVRQVLNRIMAEKRKREGRQIATAYARN